ncbi:TSUP family transporter [Thermococcus sp.]|uniref:TSUP family transporter n=1 Tax=Thermococcus sp. TaxID=35749 RepID=UPI00260CBA12|nr:TSUP family transporter [Thermococcus sp.]
MNYALLGRVGYYIALFLALGTIPGVYLGTHINMRVNKERLKRMINITILLIGLLLLFGR